MGRFCENLSQIYYHTRMCRNLVLIFPKFRTNSGLVQKCAKYVRAKTSRNKVYIPLVSFLEVRCNTSLLGLQKKSISYCHFQFYPYFFSRKRVLKNTNQFHLGMTLEFVGFTAPARVEDSFVIYASEWRSCLDTGLRARKQLGEVYNGLVFRWSDGFCALCKGEQGSVHVGDSLHYKFNV